MFNLHAFSESIDEAGVDANIAAVSDPIASVSGDFLYVGKLNNLIGYVAYTGTTGVRAKVQSPSLRRLALPQISPVNMTLISTDHDQVHLFEQSPVALESNEGIEFITNANPAAAEIHTGLVFLSDGPIAPVSGEIVTVRATATITGVDSTFVAGGLTFDQTLPVGRYQLVGARVQCANAAAARFIPVGESVRPGVPTVSTAAIRENPKFRRGGLGVWFEFDSVTPPQVEILSTASATNPIVYLDLIKVG